MRNLIIGAALAATLVPFAGASAQSWNRGYNNRDVRQEQRECQRELRRADNRREYRRELQECRREIAAAQRHNRYDRRDRWDDRYYSDRGRYWDGYRWRNR